MTSLARWPLRLLRLRVPLMLLLAPIACTWTVSGKGGLQGTEPAAGPALVDAAIGETRPDAEPEDGSEGGVFEGNVGLADGSDASSGQCTGPGCAPDAEAPRDGAEAGAREAAATTHTVGGTLTGLAAGAHIVLQNADNAELTLDADGTFAFSPPLAAGSTYAVTVRTDPEGETCTVKNGSGTVGSSDVTNVAVTCAAETFTIGGNLSGRPAGTSITLEDNGGNDLTPSANGAFSFTRLVTYGSNYDVTVLVQPIGAECTVDRGSGVAIANVTDVIIACAPIPYTIGGELSGLDPGSRVTLENDGTDSLVLTANGAFNFATKLARGTKYDVTVLSQPSGQTCTVHEGSGTADAASGTGVLVICRAR
jgi:hypothetical protein